MGRGGGFHLVQPTKQRLALPDDLLEIQLAANFIFQVQLFLGKLVSEIGDLTVGQGVLNGDRDLVCDLAQESDVIGGECILLEAAETQDTKDPVPADQRQVNSGPEALSHRETILLQFASTDAYGLAGSECCCGRLVFFSTRPTLADSSLVSGEIEVGRPT